MTPEGSTTRQVDSLAELVQIVQLTGVITYEVHGLRHTPDEDMAPRSQDDLPPFVRARRFEDKLETRVNMTVSTTEATFVADIGVIYTLNAEAEFGNGLIGEFIERVGMMAVFPFLRESIFATAARLGVNAPVLGLLRSGSFSVGPPVPDTEDG